MTASSPLDNMNGHKQAGRKVNLNSLNQIHLPLEVSLVTLKGCRGMSGVSHPAVKTTKKRSWSPGMSQMAPPLEILRVWQPRQGEAICPQHLRPSAIRHNLAGASKCYIGNKQAEQKTP